MMALSYQKHNKTMQIVMIHKKHYVFSYSHDEKRNDEKKMVHVFLLPDYAIQDLVQTVTHNQSISPPNNKHMQTA